MHRLRRYRADGLALLAILLLALAWFAPVLLPGLTHASLLPYDNLYAFAPWRSLQPGLIPHNELLSDLVLENAVWKQHIVETLRQGDIPLWNPQVFTGIPFFAGGQASTLYPLNVLFYVLPLELAYGWFTALQVAIAGAAMYILGRVLRLRRAAVAVWRGRLHVQRLSDRERGLYHVPGGRAVAAAAAGGDRVHRAQAGREGGAQLPADPLCGGGGGRSSGWWCWPGTRS